jgi:hypothetical protein
VVVRTSTFQAVPTADQEVLEAAERAALEAPTMVLEMKVATHQQKVMTAALLMMILPVVEAAQAQLVGLEQVGHRLEMVAQGHHLPYPAPLSHELAAVTPLMLQLVAAQILAVAVAVAAATQTKVVEMAAPVLSSSAMPILLQRQQRQPARQLSLLLVAIACINGPALVPLRSEATHGALCST